MTAVPLGGVNRRGLEALGTGSPASRAPGGEATLAAAEGDPETDDLAVLSAPQPVDSLATVGVTWADGERVSEEALKVSVRTETDGTWSDWETMPYHDEHGPDAGSAESGRTRPGTDPVYVGHVDDVQIKAVTDSGQAPAGMQLALVDPGAQTAAAVEKPAIDTGTLDLSSADTTGTTPTDPATEPVVPTTDPATTDPAATDPTTTDPATTDPATTDPATTDPADDASLAAGAVTAKPMIYSRAQWGADERMRDSSSLHYGEVHAGFVHHTVNANNYTAAQVPAIIRGIYAYHTQSRGWSDVGYNFLVDRFGRIWEGRYGGVDRPVVGAHTLGYNDDAFAMSAIGNYETAQPSAAVLDAYGRLFAWKLSLHGVGAGSMKQWVTKRYLPAINGHRDVGQTACPGKYLYAQIPRIRQLAVAYQKSFASRNRTANLTGTTAPDVVLRDKTTKQGYVLRSGGQSGFTRGSVARSGLSGVDQLTAVGDVTGDGTTDLLARTRSTRSTKVLPGDGTGHFGTGIKPSQRFAAADQLTGVGDWNGDGHGDVVGRNGTNKRLYVYYGDGSGGFGATHRTLSLHWGGYTTTTGAGDFDKDGHPDLVARSSDGRLWLVPGTGSRLGARRLLSGSWSGFDLTAAGGDLTQDGVPDVVARNRATKQTWVYPGNGRGGLTARRGPFTAASGVDRLLSPGQVRGSAAGDLVGRDAKGRLMVFTGSGATNGKTLVPMGRSFPSANLLLNVGDWNGDGKGDVMSRSADGVMYLLRGQGTGSFAAPVQAGTGFGSVRLLAAVGDLTGDGYPDLMGQPSGGAMRIYPSNGSSGFRASYVAYAAVTATQQVGMGLWNGDGSPDSLVRRSDGSLVLYSGNGPGGLTGATRIGSLGSGYDWLLAVGDVTGDKRQDLLARERSTGTLWTLPGTSTGFGARKLFMGSLGRFDLAG
ncbi:VCBS repeat-containing protein [Nocardioides panacis]|uniref:VCBS repeat-containing protein n=1 Tax=Nocardioides panacis TaxID=2849501 RepID=A0A975SWT0_9ACTN|nr:FG-GAP-like repeat-containing protein [Nocardioides panacis]QWZ06768.1 VCBS repeat-containing protein [Nocardioides panacis]